MEVMGLVVVLLLLVAATARADSPWSQGVTDQQKADAKVLLDAGNQLFAEHQYVDALAKYTAAIAVWDHPAIRFNMVRCEVLLGKNLEASEDLEKALKYGAAPLDEALYEQALAYQKLLASQIGTVAVSCRQHDVKITLDGKPFAACPAQEQRRVLAGPHQLVGTGPGLLAKTVDVVTIGGQRKDIDVALIPPERAATIVHRWPGYVPWLVFGGGLTLTGAGALLSALGSDQMKTFDKLVDDRCTGNCTQAQLSDIIYLKNGAELKSDAGVALMITGGAGVATSLVLLYLNRGRTVYPEVAPVPGGAAISWSGSF
jgi:tetratricopeptide (TPR) repeat protein